MRTRLAGLILFALAWGVGSVGAGSLEGLDAPAFGARVEADLRTLARSRAGLAGAVAFARSRPDLFSSDGSRPAGAWTERERLDVREIWAALLGHAFALASRAAPYSDFQDLPGADRQGAAFRAARAAFLAQYRYGLEFLDLADRVPGLAEVLDEPLADLGLPEGTWSRCRSRLLDEAAWGTDFAAQEAAASALGGGGPAWAREAASEDASFLRKALAARGEGLRAWGGPALRAKVRFTPWLPAEGARPSRGPERPLVSSAEAGGLAARLLPGDILLARREGDLSDAALPGFWRRAALYVGTPEERRRFFSRLGVEQWVRGEGQPDGDLERLLQVRSPQNYPLSAQSREGEPAPRVLEVGDRGAVFTALEQSAAADFLAVLRPRLVQVDKAAAIVRAFRHVGRPYDDPRDALAVSGLVDAELISRCYEPEGDRKGLRLPRSDVLGRPLLAVNDLARLYDAEAGSEARQFDLVLFLDGRVDEGRAVEEGEEEFRRTWRRPKGRAPVP